MKGGRRSAAEKPRPFSAREIFRNKNSGIVNHYYYTEENAKGARSYSRLSPSKVVVVVYTDINVVADWTVVAFRTGIIERPVFVVPRKCVQRSAANRNKQQNHFSPQLNRI
jgi:hypothetical protein